ncbi:TPA: VRR-NUC domain-containing protein [Salmonella enterica subsp. enterica serovar Typhimurium]|nr:VRR-NUC domain-containing protein [Salmonella enterica subsp. enterica serovar Typhimurium]HBL5549856.1 VRR-NUC domain-containing protein [Salmonella enterica subsp. enterica serovar Typhimurium]HBL5554760.1 VRR-NUC domain-containing protein [Salmonella enterica subsp. enterica serovar Typhimurium]HBL5877447.1 VRR-NUC domain-containing protein [Salmonella enterica subsp. enterica serovar Typhimurium]HBL9433931.1 VRR-NUC domain-containing protein [Salmonella enterica subsp. enterica serovar T
MKRTPEGVIQAYGMTELKKRGCLVRKIGYEGRRGCPDHLVLVPEFIGKSRYGEDDKEPRVVFIEYKATEDTRPEEHQLREHTRMRAVGADVRVIGSKRQIDELVKELFPCD